MTEMMMCCDVCGSHVWVAGGLEYVWSISWSDDIEGPLNKPSVSVVLVSMYCVYFCLYMLCVIY